MPPRKRGQSVGLDRSVILDAAAEVLAENGSSGLSMRAIASRLGVVPNALYNHFHDKTELIDALLDHTLGQVPTPLGGDPRTDLVGIMIATFDTLAAQGALVPLYIDRHGSRGPNAVALGKHMVQSFLALGLDETTAQRAIYVLIVQAIGFTAYGVSAPNPQANRAAFIDSLNWTLDGAIRSQ
jgi:AcrR family transcriptional regulator